MQHIEAKYTSLKDYYFIPTIKYHARISQISKYLDTNVGLSVFSACLILPNGKKYILSNNPGGIAIPYYQRGLSRIDNIFTLDRYEGLDYCFPDLIDNDKLGRDFLKILAQEFQTYNHYVLIRRSSEANLILTAGSSSPCGNHQQTYRETFSVLESFAIHFFDQIIDIWSNEESALKFNRFSQDKYFRKQLVRNHCDTHQASLTDKETQAIYWSSQGKSVDEIAMISGVAPATIRTHHRNAMEKLGANNITHAVSIALRLRLIS